MIVDTITELEEGGDDDELHQIKEEPLAESQDSYATAEVPVLSEDSQISFLKNKLSK